jgi:8-oxo-dGTP pyrophosphatase MutT (NUDIX family)
MQWSDPGLRQLTRSRRCCVRKMGQNPITAKRETKEETGIDVIDLEMFEVDSGQELVFVGYTNSDVGFTTDDTLKQFVRECFLSLNRM